MNPDPRPRVEYQHGAPGQPARWLVTDGNSYANDCTEAEARHLVEQGKATSCPELPGLPSTRLFDLSPGWETVYCPHLGAQAGPCEECDSVEAAAYYEAEALWYEQQCRAAGVPTAPDDDPRQVQAYWVPTWAGHTYRDPAQGRGALPVVFAP